jgi:hypothetical protein
MRLFVTIVGFAVIAFAVFQFVRGLTLGRTDRMGEGPDSWSAGDGSGHDPGGGVAPGG